VTLRGALVPIVGLVLMVGVAGCAAGPRADLEGGLQLAGTRLPIDDPRAENVLRRYLDLVQSRTAMRGSARVLLEGPDFKLNRPQRILVERPARVRFEVIGLFDQLAAMLATDGRRFDFFEVSTGEISRGVVTPTLLWDLAKIDLDLHEVVGLLLGAPMPSPGIARAAVWLEPDGRIALVLGWPAAMPQGVCADDAQQALLEPACFVSMDVVSEGGEIFLFDQSGRLSELRSLEPGGVVRFKATFEDYNPIVAQDGEADYPNRITIRSSAAESLARFDWKRVMLADELSDRLFEIPVRAGAKQDG
jgi:hypothetical protein